MDTELFSPIGFALIAVCFRSASDIIYRIAMQTKLDPLVTATWNSILGCIVLLSLLQFPDVTQLTTSEIILLVLAGSFWALQVVFHIKSYQGLGASLNAILDLARFVLLNLAGIFIFSEAISAVAVVGLLLIVLSILSTISGSYQGSKNGVLYRMASVLSGTVALVVEKHLSRTVNFDIIILVGFVLPVFLYLLWRPSLIKQLVPAVRSNMFHLVVTSVLYAGAATFLTYGFGSGDLSVTMTIYQSSFVLTLFLSIILLKETDEMRKRLLSAAGCVVGVVLVSYF